MHKKVRQFISSLSILSLSFAAAVPNVTAVRAEEESPYGDIDGDPIVSEVELTAREVSEDEIKTGENVIEEAVTESGLVSIIVELDDPCVLEAGLEPGSAQAQAYADRLRLKQESAMLAAREYVVERISEPAVKEKVAVGNQFVNVMNGFVITAPKSMISQLKKLPNVKRAYASVAYEAPETVEQGNEPDLGFSTGMVGADKVNQSGYSGEGLVIGIIDTGLDLYHQAFAADPANPKIAAGTVFSGTNGTDTYKSLKVPFGYDYGDEDPDIIPVSTSSNGSHGTHVAGITAGNDSVITGVAPDAQLAIFKVFADNSNWTYDYQIANALEDAVIVKPDVLNLSLGSPSGGDGLFGEESFYDEQLAMGEVYRRVYDYGIPLSISAGNEYFFTVNGAMNSTPHIGIVGSPSTYYGALSVASVENLGYTSTSMYISGYGYTVYADYATDPEKRFKTLAPNWQGFEYDICGKGKPEDFENIEIEGKVAVVENGDISIIEKQHNAAAAGATGVIVYNDREGSVPNMIIDQESIPCVSISKAAGEALLNAEEKRVYEIADNVNENGRTGIRGSAFSSWGTTDDLRMKPEIAAPGGNIYSSVVGGYESYNGTSMAAPHVAAAIALVRAYARNEGLAETDQDLDRIAIQLLMSTAHPGTDINTGAVESARHLGAGMININDAMASHAYLSVDTAEEQKPKLELGDDPEKKGVYPVTFNVTNISGSPQTYNLTCSASSSGKPMAMGGMPSIALDCSISGDTKVIVPANSKVAVNVTLTLGSEGRNTLENTPMNCGFMDGYIYLNPTADSADATELSIPYQVFYGDWESLPVLDTTLEHGLDYINGINGLVSYDAYAELPYPTENAYFCHMIGMNPLESKNFQSNYWNGDYYFDDYDRKYMLTSSLLDPQLAGLDLSDAAAADITKHFGVYSIGISILKNVNWYQVKVTDANSGTLYYDNGGEDCFFRKNPNQVGRNDFGDMVIKWPATDQNGNALAEGTEVNVEVIASADHGAHTGSMVLPVKIDNTKPYIVGSDETEDPETGLRSYSKAILATTESGKKFLKVEGQDNMYLAAARVGTSLITRTHKPFEDSEDESLAQLEVSAPELDGVVSWLFFYGEEENEVTPFALEVTDIESDTYYLELYDYANHKSFYEVSADQEATVSLKLTPEETTVTVGEERVNVRFTLKDGDGYEIKASNLNCKVIGSNSWSSYFNSRNMQLEINPTETAETLTVRVSFNDDPDVYAEATVHLEYLPAIEMVGRSLSLDGKIGINYYVDIPEDKIATSTVLIRNDYPMKVEEIMVPAASGQEKTVTVNGVQRKTRLFHFETVAKEMGDDVSFQIINDETDSARVIKYNENGTDHRETIYWYSVNRYLDAAMQTDNDLLKKMAETLGDYGKYAQYYFDYRTWNIDNEPQDNSDVTWLDFEPYAAVTSGSVTGLRYIGASLELEADTGFRLYFTPESGHSINEYTFTVDGKPLTPVQRSAGSSTWYVAIENIAGKELGLAKNVKITSGSETMTVAYSALSYGYTVMTNDSTDEKIRNVVRALYLYNLAAIDYFKDKQ